MENKNKTSEQIAVEFQKKSILDSIPDIAWLKDEESRFIAVNDAFGKACGVKPEDLAGKTDLDIWPKDLAERYRADDREVMLSKKRKAVEEPLADKTGKIQWIETIKTPVLNTSGKVIGTAGIARDITERKLLEERLEVEEDAVTENLNFLVKEFRIPRNSSAIKSLEESIEKIKDLLVKAKELAEMHEDDKSKYLHLAALGLMAEIVVHELNRSSANVIASLKEIEKEELPSAVESQLNTLLAEMKTLQKRLKIFDPLSTRGRQVKETFDIVSWVDDNMSAHKSQFGRHSIKLNFTVRPIEDGKLYVKAVKGMIVQILENLIDNSVYWIKEYKKSHKHYKPEITVEIDTTSSKLYFSDNGPGIPPERAEEVFLPFFSTKPFKLGKGLGLYISREIAEYNAAKLYLSEKKNNLGNLSTFVLELSNGKK